MFAALLGSVATGQAPPEQESFRDLSEVASVLVPVTVRDARGRIVANLERDAFRLYVDGLEFPIRSFWREGGLPLSLAFVLDTSGSMGTLRAGRARQAIVEFVSRLGPRDEACLITFGGGEVKRRLAFGNDPKLIPRILATLESNGTTALYDVIAAAPQIMDGAHNVRRAVLLFTDGVDTASRLAPADAERILEGLSDPLYAFGIEPPPRPEAGQPSYETVLAELADASGGSYMAVKTLEALAGQVRDLRRELTLRYIISFEPSGLGVVKWRGIEVRVEGDYEVIARHGYRGTLP